MCAAGPAAPAHPGSVRGIEVWRDTQGSAADAGRARSFVRDVLAAAGLDGEPLDDVVLGASELATNAIRHAGGIVEVRVDVDDDRVRVEVDDSASGAVLPRQPGTFDTTGRGLLIVEGLATRWGTAAAGARGKTVWFEVARPLPDETLEADLGGTDRLRLPAPRQIVAALAGASAAAAVAAAVAGGSNPEARTALWGALVVAAATVWGGFPAGLAATTALAGSAAGFRDRSDTSPGLLALALGVGGAGVTFFSWAGLELRARARARSRLLDRLARLGEDLGRFDELEDPLGGIAAAAAEAAGASRAELRTQDPGSGGPSATVLPLSDTSRYRWLVLRMPTGANRRRSPARATFDAAIAQRCAEALRSLELRDAERRARADLELLVDLSRVLVGVVDASEVAQGCVQVLVPRLADGLELRLANGASGPSEASGDVAQLALRARHDEIGQLVAWRTRGRFDDGDGALLAEVAARVASSLDTALLYGDLVQTNDILEQSLLPRALATVDGIDVAARYLPAEGRHRVGGDFYDVLPISDDEVVLIVGDVQGKGVEAATLTALARHTLRGAAFAGLGPAGMLAQLNQALRADEAERSRTDPDALLRFVTAVVVRVRRRVGGARAVLGRAGHPLPLVVHPDGRVDRIHPPGTILGAFEDPRCREVEIDLGLSDTLVLYTDGVVEHRQALDLFDEDQLGRLVRNQLTAVTADAVAGVILDTAVGVSRTDWRDDIAILVARVTSDTAPVGRSDGPTPAP